MVAVAFGAIPWALLRRNLSSKEVCFFGFKSILVALLPAAAVGILFAQLHSNYFENKERLGDFFSLIGPAYFLIVLCALMAFLLFLFHWRTSPTAGEKEVYGNTFSPFSFSCLHQFKPQPRVRRSPSLLAVDQLDVC